SRALSVLLAPRSAADPARRVGRIASGGGGDPAPPRRSWRAPSPRRVPPGVGVLVLGNPRGSHLVSDCRVLPVAAPEAVVGLRADDDPRRLGARDRRHRRRIDLAGARDVRDRAAPRRRPPADPSAAVRPAPRSAAPPPPRA